MIITIIYRGKFKSKNNKENEPSNDDKIIYKGEKISRTKLITDFLSRVSDDERIIGREKQRFLNYSFLPEYTDD